MPATKKPTPAPAVPRLRASPTFALAHTLDGRPYVAKEVEPYVQFWLSERERVVLSMFSGRHGATVTQAVDDVLRLTRPADKAAEKKKLAKTISDMRAAGVLVDTRDDTSRYDAAIAPAYIAHRPFPPKLVDGIVRDAGIGPKSRVLDLAGGPGSLALQLARVSNDVTLMDLSRGFLNAAKARAKALGVKLETVHESCNRLVHSNDEVDLITVSQALHWLDDVQVCRGVCRVLKPDGSFVVIHTAIEVADTHPLAHLFGHDSILGAKRRQSFTDEVEPLRRRLALLFEALDAPDVERHDISQYGTAADAAQAARIGYAGATISRQRRPYDLGFARAFLTDSHIARTGQAPADFWRDVESRCAAASAAELEGDMLWAVLRFQRGGVAPSTAPLAELPVNEIGFAPISAASGRRS